MTKTFWKTRTLHKIIERGKNFLCNFLDLVHRLSYTIIRFYFKGKMKKLPEKTSLRTSWARWRSSWCTCWGRRGGWHSCRRWGVSCPRPGGTARPGSHPPTPPYHTSANRQDREIISSLLCTVLKVISSNWHCQKVPPYTTGMFVIDHKEKVSLISHKIVGDLTRTFFLVIYHKPFCYRTVM